MPENLKHFSKIRCVMIETKSIVPVDAGGPGYRGACFPNDTLALARIAPGFGTPWMLVEAAIAVNGARKSDLALRVTSACGGSVRGKAIAGTFAYRGVGWPLRQHHLV